MKQVPLFAAVGICALLISVNCARRAQPVAAVAPPPPVVEETPPPSPPDPEPAPAPVAALTEEEIFARKTLDELNAERPLADIFFDFDQFVVREDARSILQTNAEWLRRWTSIRITIEGHGDSRGTSEYNLALGDRRANAAKQYLLSLGVADDRMLVVSKGEEQPFCREESDDEDIETCWQENRRGHFLITAK